MRRPARSPFRPSVGVIVAFTMLLAGCSPATSGGRDAPSSAVALRTFDGCDALTTELRRRERAQVAVHGRVLPGAGAGAVAADAGRTASAEAAAPSTTAASGAWSGTNVQVAGVDEPDIVKSDGAHLYTLADGRLRIVDVRDARPRVVASVAVDDGAPRELLLHEGRVLLLGDDAASSPERDLRTPDVEGSSLLPIVPVRTRLWSVDVAVPSDPRVTSSIAVEGGLVTARQTDGTARVVIRSFPFVPYAPATRDASPRADVGALTADRWLPRVALDDGSAAPLVECTSVRAPQRGDDLGLVSVLSFDLARPDLDARRADAVLGAADTVYADADTLYVTTSRWPVVLPVEPVPMPRPLPLDPLPEGGPDGSQELPVEPGPLPEAGRPQPDGRAGPEQAIPDIPPPADGAGAPRDLPLRDGRTVRPEEPIPDIPLPRDPSPSAVTTEVHRFDLDGDGATYVASGSVPGTVLNQWALSEHDDHLRIATTIDDGRSRSAVHILRRDGSRLVETGRVGDLGRGERIYAVRYAGPLGFVVTFRQIDPLYTLDLSDPTAPAVLGELKIPGYSAYLHPVGADHLLGIGQAADADGTVTGAQVSLFDVSDPRSPTRSARLGLGSQTSSPVEHDHRALLVWPDRDLVAVPVEHWDSGRTEVLALTATDDGRLVERGTVDVGATSTGAMVRAVVVGERLITVTPGAVTTSDLDTLEPLATVRL